jgi:hypothetical protein
MKEEVIIYDTTKAYTKNQYYVKGFSVYRNNARISSFSSNSEANKHAQELNKRFGDIEAYDLLNKIRDEITLYEDVEFTPEVIIISIKAMLDSKERI